ncbi:hypothetical protein [Variovorax sp. RCC_210]|uniref:hypothetical protein n=1 Tax=Variovorax sp. RCC_210 TaxID=3239217 RepID=UPI003523BA32
MTQGTPWSAIADKWTRTSTGGVRNVGELISGVQVDKFFVPPARPGGSGRWCVVLQDGRTFERYDCYVEWSPHGWNPSSCRREDAERPA